MCRNIFLLAFLYLVGLSASLYLSSLSITQSSAFCELFGSDCATVALSSYGSLWGFSTASFGLGYFVCQFTFLVYFTLASRISGKQLNSAPALVLNIAACLTSLIFIAILFLILNATCFACMIVHAVNFLTLPLNFIVWQKLKKEESRPTALVIAVLLGAIGILIVQIIDIRHVIKVADEQAQDSLELVLHNFDKAKEYTFLKESGDAIYGEPDIAVHQIVLIYKETCPGCAQAKKKLIDLVEEHYQSIWLLTINYANLTKEQLEEMDIDRVPAVFINGKRAAGWEIKGFMKTFIEDCEC